MNETKMQACILHPSSHVITVVLSTVCLGDRNIACVLSNGIKKRTLRYFALSLSLD